MTAHCLVCGRRWFACTCDVDRMGAQFTEVLMRQQREQAITALYAEHDRWAVRTGRTILDAHRHCQHQFIDVC